MTDKFTFLAPPDAIHGDRVILPETEAHHASRVLRLASGNEILAVDGVGGRFRVRLDAVHRSRVTGTIVERLPGDSDPAPDVTLAVGLLKNAGRFETMLEKAAELGVGRIVPLVTARTEARRLRMERARGILVSAMKQSGRARLVHLAEPTSFDDAIRDITAERILLCHEAVDPAAGLAARARGTGSCAVLVGPEGGFTEDEVAAASAAGWDAVSLGPARLRTETAAIAAATLVLLAHKP